MGIVRRHRRLRAVDGDVQVSTADGRYSPEMPARSASGERGRPRKLTLFGHFGSPNPGNESTLITIVDHLRSRDPNVELRCVCTGPEVVAERDRVAAIPITTRDARIWDLSLPLSRRVPMALAGVAEEVRQYVRAFGELDRTDALIMPGTGLLTDAYGLTSWGPYNQFKWTLMAKLRRCRVLFVSVGAGPIDGAWGRALIRATLALADFRSYRDEASRDRLQAIGVSARRDSIYPDLVFGLAQARLPNSKAETDSRRRVVGLGLMVYAGTYSVRDPRPETYQTYLRSLAAFAAWLLEHDYDIRLLLGDADTAVIGDFRSALSAQVPAYERARVVEYSISSVGDILGEIDACDLVVATRFHNVLLAMLLAKPVIALSFHHKVASLMDQMGLREYCHDIHRIDAERLLEQFGALERNEATVKRTIAAGVAHARASLQQQDELLFGPPAVARGTANAAEGRDRRRRLETAYLGIGERVWRRLPPRARGLTPVRAYGSRSHALVRRRAEREMYLGTLFLRNRPALELLRRLVEHEPRGARVTIAVLGCSIGVEVYSILWTLRRSRPDLEVVVDAVDISPEVVDVARRGVYSPASSEMVGASVFDALTETERAEMFDWDGDEATIKPWLRAGITWRVGDAGDPGLIASLGPHDLVVANNFLCHLTPADARRCLRIIAGLPRPGGHLLVTGVDLDVRTSTAFDLGWEPLDELRSEIHDGDPIVRSDWPWRWWGVEPLDRRRPDWEMRYSAAFRIADLGSTRDDAPAATVIGSAR